MTRKFEYEDTAEDVEAMFFSAVSAMLSKYDYTKEELKNHVDEFTEEEIEQIRKADQMADEIMKRWNK